MADAKRGFVPEDERNFSTEAIEKMRIASRHMVGLFTTSHLHSSSVTALLRKMSRSLQRSLTGQPA